MSKILIVDDSRTTRAVLKDCLRTAGYGRYELIEAGSVAEAIRMIATMGPDLVLTDLYMPGMTGMDLLAMLKSKNIQCKVGFVTSETHEQLHETAISEGALFVLTKPPKADDLKRELSKVL